MNEESRGLSESTDSPRLRQVEEIGRISGGAALWDLEWYLPEHGTFWKCWRKRLR